MGTLRLRGGGERWLLDGCHMSRKKGDFEGEVVPRVDCRERWDNTQESVALDGEQSAREAASNDTKQ